MALRRRKQKKGELPVFGTSLVEEFVSSFNNQVLILSLKHEAEQNEQRALSSIASAGSYGAVYVLPQDIPVDQQAIIAKTSVNAHMQKAQALQAEAYSAQQQQIQEQLLRSKYVGLKVLVRVMSNSQSPVETCWRNKKTGELSYTQWSPKKLAGIIQDIDLEKNSITMRPTRLRRSMNQAVQYYRVYIMNPDNAQPMVSLTIV